MKHGIIIAGSGRGLYFADLLARTPGLKESCSVKAVVDIRKENHDALRTRLNESGLTETKILTTLPEALEALPCKEAQSVLIVTPNTTHAELAEQSLRAGRHLLLEKPIAADWRDRPPSLILCRTSPHVMRKSWESAARCSSSTTDFGCCHG